MKKAVKGYNLFSVDHIWREKTQTVQNAVWKKAKILLWEKKSQIHTEENRERDFDWKNVGLYHYHDQFISWVVSRTPSLTSVWVIVNIFVSFNVNLLIINALWMFINVWSDSRSSTLTSLLHFLPSSRLLINENILHINQCKYFPSFSWQLKFHSKTLQSSVG